MRRMLVSLACCASLSLAGCGSNIDPESLEPLDKIDFRPNSEFGFDALMLGLRLGKQEIDARMPEDGVARAEGYRYLLRLVEMNLGTLTADQDAARPQLSRCPTRNCRLGFDNPDYTYVGVNPLSKDYNYRLYGDRGTAAYFWFQVLERSTGAFGGTSKTRSQDMVFAPDGSWEIFLGAEKPDGVPDSNFLELKEEQATMVIRIAHRDWDSTIEPSITVENLGAVEAPIEPFKPMRMAITGFGLSKMIPNQVKRWIGIIEGAPLNDVARPCRGWANGCSNTGGFGNFSAGGKYAVAEDEALIIEAPWLPAGYTNIQLGNIWGESLDYANKQTSLNDFQAHLNGDNVYRYVLSHRDPGVPNWLDISDHPEGGIFMRWVEPEEGRDPPKPNGKVVKLAALREHLPADTPKISSAERAEVLKRRLMAYNRRMSPANISAP